MGLTPASVDPKRKEELKRRDKEPASFGIVNGAERPKDCKPTGLKGDTNGKQKQRRKKTGGQES